MMVRILAACTLFTMAAPLAVAQPSTSGDSLSICCPNCQATCVFEAKPTTVEKKCFDIECKPICIPRVRFPWQKCDEPMRADVKWVNVLTTKKYECQECKYSWRVEAAPSNACGRGCTTAKESASAIGASVRIRHAVLARSLDQPTEALPSNVSARRVSYSPTTTQVARPGQTQPPCDSSMPAIRVRLRDEWITRPDDPRR